MLIASCIYAHIFIYYIINKLPSNCHDADLFKVLEALISVNGITGSLLRPSKLVGSRLQVVYNDPHKCQDCLGAYRPLTQIFLA